MTWHILVYAYVILGVVNAALMDYVGRKIGQRAKVGDLTYTTIVVISFFLWPLVLIAGILPKKEK